MSNLFNNAAVPTTQTSFHTPTSRLSVDQEVRAGAGWTGYHRGRKVLWGREGMGPKTEVYDAEMLALLRASMQAMRFARKGTTFIPTWTTSNDRADDLAKEAARHIDSLAASCANARRRKVDLLKKRTEIWRPAAQTGRFTLSYPVNTSPPPPVKYKVASSSAAQVMGLSENTTHRSYLPNPLVALVGNCAKLEHMRVHLHEVPHNLVPSKIMDTEKGIMALVKFIEKSNVFEKDRHRHEEDGIEEQMR
ncbi:hypothetical protein DFJ58DRAFT_843161 [Suillus subalutaceus]|uniref:uncharacterized protein n=1 Tax=Suillus subalutaceus TaxID=48586 RepID=UPI001B85E6FD|nr:uncharacterized protein DFJ58DRAFT_843161 [Suillus subalutaceus]KAG1847521.1 hypothetical protein DFJ58DRAFT_843161 [Suillus subalutaceus]